MEFVNMILHLVISCDPCIDRQIHTYQIMACISDVLVKSDLKFYFMGICKDINTNVCHLYIFQSRQKRKEYYLYPINKHTWEGSVSGSGTGPLDSESRVPVPDLDSDSK